MTRIRFPQLATAVSALAVAAIAPLAGCGGDDAPAIHHYTGTGYSLDFPGKMQKETVITVPNVGPLQVISSAVSGDVYATTQVVSPTGTIDLDGAAAGALNEVGATETAIEPTTVDGKPARLATGKVTQGKASAKVSALVVDRGDGSMLQLTAVDLNADNQARTDTFFKSLKFG